MADADTKETVTVGCYQPPSIVDLLRVEEAGFLANHIGEPTIGVQVVAKGWIGKCSAEQA